MNTCLPAKTATDLLTVVIATYRREKVLIDSIRQLLAIKPGPDQIIVVDQTISHEPEILQELQKLDRCGAIRWLKREQPSIPAAMNVGLLAADAGIVLFLDDDIKPDAELISAHRRAQAEYPGLVAGQVLQPGESRVALAPTDRFRFNSNVDAFIDEFIGCNFSVLKEYALSLGGFDENFSGAAYRFEAEFAFRYIRRYGPIRFEPSASIHHLQASSGGTRAHGHHLRTVKASHSVGAYYFWFRTREPHWWLKMLLRPLRSIRTKHHMLRPWWVPLTLIAEFRGMLQAFQLALRGPSLIAPNQQAGTKPLERETP